MSRCARCGRFVGSTQQSKSRAGVPGGRRENHMSLTHRAHKQRRDAIVAALHLSAEEAELALQSATVRATVPDEVLVQQGETADSLYVITRGRFEVDVVGMSGATRAVRML